MIDLSKLSENLQELMYERGLTQTSLAEAMHTCSSKISSYLTERRAPNYDTFVGFIEFFHCSADFLLGLKENVYENDTYKPVQPFHERLRTILRKTETSQYLFVKRTKISWGVFYHWLTGKSKPSLDNLIKVANYFDCSVDFLLGRI